MRKNEDNPNQRWTFRSNGSIALKVRPSLVLTVRMPALENTNIEININEEEAWYSLMRSLMDEASVILQPAIETDYGNSHQKWYVDEQIGFIYSFAALNDPNNSETKL